MSATHDRHSTPAPPPRSTWPSTSAGPPGTSPPPPASPRSLDSGPSPHATSTPSRTRSGGPDETPVLSCYEAARDGFWLHRYLTHARIQNLVVDAASIEVNRRARRAKSDSLDVAKLLTMLIRYHGGEHKLWGVVRVPTVEDEDRRQPHRELMAVKGQRAEHSNRIKGLLANLGLGLVVDEQLPEVD